MHHTLAFPDTNSSDTLFWTKLKIMKLTGRSFDESGCVRLQLTGRSFDESGCVRPSQAANILPFSFPICFNIWKHCDRMENMLAASFHSTTVAWNTPVMMSSHSTTAAKERWRLLTAQLAYETNEHVVVQLNSVLLIYIPKSTCVLRIGTDAWRPILFVRICRNSKSVYSMCF